ncbi:hypothetical protein [Algibacillus agarilyticus]|uniref:hypothetical protein n=1 Tax=Algibacillus agarilyticus TaxID=2234133 RepID=UPI000DD00905|nr:hypothetical protein [Algibacillus agarilyticus]
MKIRTGLVEKHASSTLFKRLYITEDSVAISQLKAMRRFRKGMRFIGGCFIVLGGFMLYQFVGILLDPEATITYNGVPTNDYAIKLNASIFVGSFVLIGLITAFAPTKLLNKLFVLKMSLKSSFGYKK